MDKTNLKKIINSLNLNRDYKDKFFNLIYRLNLIDIKSIEDKINSKKDIEQYNKDIKRLNNYIVFLQEASGNPIEITFDGENQKMYYVEDASLIPSTTTDILKVSTYYTAADCPIRNNKIKWFSFYNSTNDATNTKITVKGGRGIIDLHKSFERVNDGVLDGIRNINLSLIDTSNVTTLVALSQYGFTIESIGDLSNWDVSKVTLMGSLFNKCYKLKTVGDLSNWNVSQVTTMNNLFNNCLALDSIGDISNWDTSNVNTMNAMFTKCNSLKSIGDLSNWNVSKVTKMTSQFAECYLIESIGDLSNWNVENVTSMETMFNKCYNLKSVGDISNWNISNVTSIYGIFAVCYKLKSLGNLSDWNTGSVTKMGYMFSNSFNLKHIGELTNWNTANVTSMEYMFHCTPIEKHLCNNWVTSKATNFKSCFGRWNRYECMNFQDYTFTEDEIFNQYNMKEVHIKNWDTVAATTESSLHMFDTPMADDKGNVDNPYINLTIIELGNKFFNTPVTNITTFKDIISWSRESMMQSLYTNQIGRDTTKVKTVTLHPTAFARLSSDDIQKIASVGLNVVKG